MHDNSTVTRFPPQLPVKQIATAAQALIDLLDSLGGDADAEDATDAEDEGLQLHLQHDNMPGCPASDNGDVAWVEWDRMPPSSKGGPNITGNIAGRCNEDDEDDDPPEAAGDEEDTNNAEDELTAGGTYFLGAGCPIADPAEHSLRERAGKQPELLQSPVHEDAEEDDGGGDVITEDEPGFDPISRAVANVLGADGPGGGSLLDSDYGADGC